MPGLKKKNGEKIGFLPYFLIVRLFTGYLLLSRKLVHFLALSLINTVLICWICLAAGEPHVLANGRRGKKNIKFSKNTERLFACEKCFILAIVLFTLVGLTSSPFTHSTVQSSSPVPVRLFQSLPRPLMYLG